MSDFLTIALVCASSVQAPACSRDTALDVITAPVRTPMECIRRGQAVLAGSGLAAGEGVYVKVACERRRGTASASPILALDGPEPE